MWRMIFEWYVIGAFCPFVAMRVSVVLMNRMGFEYALIAGIIFPILFLILIVMRGSQNGE